VFGREFAHFGIFLNMDPNNLLEKSLDLLETGRLWEFLGWEDQQTRIWIDHISPLRVSDEEKNSEKIQESADILAGLEEIGFNRLYQNVFLRVFETETKKSLSLFQALEHFIRCTRCHFQLKDSARWNETLVPVLKYLEEDDPKFTRARWLIATCQVERRKILGCYHNPRGKFPVPGSDEDEEE
jgi:hypothetical protein